MEAMVFRKLLDSVQELSLSQLRLLKAKVLDGEARVAPASVLETSCRATACPHCGCQQIHKWGVRNGIQRYQCQGCCKTFNSMTGTPLARLHKPSVWAEFAICLKDGDSVRKSAQACGIHRNTAFSWRHRFLRNAKSILPVQLNGIVEADETFVLKSEKGARHIGRKPRKRGGSATQRGISGEQSCILVCRDRGGNTVDKVIDGFDSTKLALCLSGLLSKDALLCTDGKPVYQMFARKEHVKHMRLNFSNGIRVVGGVFHVQNVNAYHSRLKRWMARFNGVATKYLDSYLAWFRELDEFGKNISPSVFLIRAHRTTPYKEQPYLMT